MITITCNYPCNTISFPSNKANKLPCIKLDYNKIAYSYDDIGIVVLKPIIDRITFGFSPTQEFINKYSSSITEQEYKNHIKGLLYGDAAHNTNNSLISGVSLVTGVPFMKKPYKNYNVNIRYKPPSSDASIFIQIAPKEPQSKLSFMRFDMNPSHFSKKAIEEFRAFIEELLVTPEWYIPYEDFIAAVSIYRADVAVDILGARPYELELKSMTNKKPAAHKSHTYNSATGRMETIYLGETEKDYRKYGEVDARECLHCETISFAEHTQTVMQSSFKAPPPSFIDEIQRDLRATVMKADHIIFMGYSLPKDDVTYRAFFSARCNDGNKSDDKKPRVKCTIVNYDSKHRGWYKPEQLKNLFKDNDEHVVNSAKEIFGENNVRFYGSGIPDVFLENGKATDAALEKLLNWDI